MGSEQDLPGVDIRRSQERGVEVISLAGELDLRSAAAVEEALDELGVGAHVRLCLDLSALEFIDSTGMAAVFRTHQAVTKAGGGVVVVCTPGHVRRTFETAGLMRIVGVVDSRDAALRKLADAR